MTIADPTRAPGRPSQGIRFPFCALALALLATPRAAAQEPPADPPAPPAQAPDQGPPPESPAPPPAPPTPPPPPAPPETPPAQPAPPVPDEPIVLPEDPPSRAPERAPAKTPARASFPPEPPQTRAAPAPKPYGAQQSTPPPIAEPEHESSSPPPAPRSDAVLSPPESKPKDGEKDDDTDGVFGPFRIGGLLGVGLPSVLSFGGAIKLTRYFGAGLNIGLIPTIRISLYGEAELSYQEYDIYGRIFPFGGMFFVGAGVGYATIAGSLKNSYDVSAYQISGLTGELSVESQASVRTLVLTPQIGLQHTFGSGLTLGIDAGAQIPLAPSEIEFETKLPAVVEQYPELIDKYVEPNNQKVRDTLDTIGRAIVPTFNLRIGWLL